MDVELLYVERCPSVAVARQRLAEAARRASVDIVVRERVVGDEAEAAALGMRGSPTVLVKGADVSGEPDHDPSLSCRLYLGDRGLDGAPAVEEIAAALTRASGRGAAGQSRDSD